jgi:hypothetical protein
MLIYRHALRALALLRNFVISLLAASASHAATMGETPEIKYTGTQATLLVQQAQRLGNAAKIYEYLHNTLSFEPYHGSRSGSINTLLGQRGNAIDIASTLIAMLRSQNIPSRYVVGTIQLPAERLMNWLGAGNIQVAIQLLKDHGIQNISWTVNYSSVSFEHVWVEALVPFDQYRGINIASPPVDCSVATNAGLCSWVPLDASYKQKIYNQLPLTLNPIGYVSFNFTDYENAIRDNNSAMRDKNPLDIYENAVAAWLRAAHPGKTIVDLLDVGKIIQIHDGLLPASLPYEVVGTVRRYDSVSDHDGVVPTTEGKTWAKYVRISTKFTLYRIQPSGQLGVLISQTTLARSVLQAEAALKPITLTTEYVNPATTTPRLNVWLGDQLLFQPIAANHASAVDSTLEVTVSMDANTAPDSSSSDNVLSTTFNARLGGQFGILAGGPTSNWSQVQRAAKALMAANNSFPIVLNASEAGCTVATGIGCTPYVDTGATGWDSNDKKLASEPAALNALTGGLLNVVGHQFMMENQEKLARLTQLVAGSSTSDYQLTLVSSDFGVEYLSDTAFAIQPGMLGIDSKSIGSLIYLPGNGVVNVLNSLTLLEGHIGSAVQHEVWQKMTGYDAISTMRGFQKLIAGGAQLSEATQTVGGYTEIATSANALLQGATRNYEFKLTERYETQTNILRSTNYSVLITPR